MWMEKKLYPELKNMNAFEQQQYDIEHLQQEESELEPLGINTFKANSMRHRSKTELFEGLFCSYSYS